MVPVILAGLVVYVTSFDGVFLFDDAVHILQNERIHGLWPLQEVLSGRRPVVDLTLAFNFALGGVKVEGYHAVNLAVHVIAALTLYGIIRRTLLRKRFRDRFGRASSHLALTVAVIWAVHPLQTQSVTYVIQRAESLMGLFYLLTLYCVIRGADSSRHIKWYAAAIVFCALGMGSKAVMVTAPVMVLLYDRVFLSESSVETFRRRWGLYLCLAATWCVLWVCGLAQGVLSTSRKVATVGFSFKDITPPEYALTQFGVLVKYLNLSFWPYPLCLDYAWPVARTVGVVVVPAIIIVALFVAVVWALIRGRWWGFVGAWFFVILAPTSSFIPIKDTFFEHRMYLPLAGVVTMVVIGGECISRYLAIYLSLANSLRRFAAVVLTGVIVVVLGYGTAQRNRNYHTAVLMWRDVVARRPENPRAHEQLGTALVASGKWHEAIPEYREAIQLDPDFTSAHANLGNALTQTGRFEEAIRHYNRVRELDPYHVDARINLGHALDMLDHVDESIDAYREAARIDPRRANPQALARAHYNLGSAVGRQGDLDNAVAEYREALDLWPEYDKVHFSLGWILSRQGDIEEAIEHYRATLEINPDHAHARQALNEALRHLQQPNPD